METITLQPSTLKKLLNPGVGPSNQDVFLFVAALIVIVLIFCIPHIVRRCKKGKDAGENGIQ